MTRAQVPVPVPVPVAVYGALWCAETNHAREHLDLMGVPYDFVDVDEDDQGAELVEEWNWRKEADSFRRSIRRRRRGRAVRSLRGGARPRARRARASPARERGHDARPRLLVIRRSRAWVAILIALAIARGASGQGAPPPPSPHPEAARARAAAAHDAPLGIALEEVAYPHPVRFLPLQIEGQDVRMAYMDVAPSGRANGRAVLLLHGKNFSGDYWSGTIGVLAAAGYRVVVPDQIGFGKSSIAGIRYSFDLLAANTAKLLDALGISRACVVGHSMGGMLAVRFARNFPERTERLVLVNPIGLEDYRIQVPPLPFETVYARELANTDRDRIDAFFRRYFAVWRPEFERFTDRRTRVGGSGEYPRFARASALTYQMIYEQPVRHEFSLIAVPTLLVVGQSDRTTIGRGLVPDAALKGLGDYPALGKAAARDIPGSRLLRASHRGSGHLLHAEAAQRSASALFEIHRTPERRLPFRIFGRAWDAHLRRPFREKYAGCPKGSVFATQPWARLRSRFSCRTA